MHYGVGWSKFGGLVRLNPLISNTWHRHCSAAFHGSGSVYAHRILTRCTHCRAGQSVGRPSTTATAPVPYNVHQSV